MMRNIQIGLSSCIYKSHRLKKTRTNGLTAKIESYIINMKHVPCKYASSFTNKADNKKSNEDQVSSSNGYINYESRW